MTPQFDPAPIRALYELPSLKAGTFSTDKIIDGIIAVPSMEASTGWAREIKLNSRPMDLETWHRGSDATVIHGDNIIANKLIVTGKRIVNNYKQDFDEGVWTIELPGVPREEIEVFTVPSEAGATLYVEPKDKQRLSRFLDKGEKVKTVKLDLGVLTITIDRPYKRESIEIG